MIWLKIAEVAELNYISLKEKKIKDFCFVWIVFFFWFMHGHCLILPIITISVRGRRVGDLMVVGFTTTYAISVYHH
jgi:hypothetical protein